MAAPGANECAGPMDRALTGVEQRVDLIVEECFLMFAHTSPGAPVSGRWKSTNGGLLVRKVEPDPCGVHRVCE